MPLAPRLLALATAVPPHALGQEEVVERVKRLFGRSAELDRLLPVFVNSGIARVQYVMTTDGKDGRPRIVESRQFAGTLTRNALPSL